MGYIKSHSNYVIKKKHQLADGGVVYERDMTTIGGLNQFAPNQTPIYKSGNFIITVNQDVVNGKDVSKESWLSNGDGELWSLSNMEDNSNQASTESLDIVLKQDYFRLQDFAYFGSCVELIRSSITDIIEKFPGELYGPNFDDDTHKGIPVFYTVNGQTRRLGGEDLYLLDNPFNINLHTTVIDEETALQNPLKYFANLGHFNYEIFNGDDTTSQKITDWTSNPTDTFCIGEKIADILINGTIHIYAFLGDLNVVYYLVKEIDLDKHIRPQNAYFNAFWTSLDEFQKVLLNKDSNPKYSALFEIISENEFAYSNTLTRFTFPITYGGYNLAVNNQAYAFYLDKLSSIAEFYDERFCDNLYRSMTHESIKNFDWTYSREFNEGDADEYIIGGTRVQKAIRLIAREFDEIKLYTDGIGTCNTITYNGANNLPDYFLTDTLDIDGWDIHNIYPFVGESGGFSEDTTLLIRPYSKDRVINGISNNEKYTHVGNRLITRIKPYTLEKDFSMNEVNNHFMRMLKLNSKEILRHKGTIEGIEMILGLFGLKSQRFIDSLDALDRLSNDLITPDYSITEYVAFTTGLTDSTSSIDNTENKWYHHSEMDRINWYNSTKTLTYDTIESRSGIYVDYQGLPLRAVKNGNETHLYPFFSTNMLIDGNPYYQMYGGWMNKSHQINQLGEVVHNQHTNTLRNISTVSNLQELISVPYDKLYDGCVYKVQNIGKPFVIVDGVMYDLYEEYNATTQSSALFFKVSKNYGSVKIGHTTFLDTLTVATPQGEVTYQLDQYQDNSTFKIYVIDNVINVYEDGLSIKNYHIFQNGKDVTNNMNGEATNYFQLYKKEDKNIIGGTGWNQIYTNEEIYDELASYRNYFKGNNPHSGNFKYDEGREYISYFTHLFKYAIENNKFDIRCYEDETNYRQAKEYIKQIGFKDLLVNGTQCGEYKKYADSKVHYFGDYITSSNNAEPIYYTEFGGNAYLNQECPTLPSSTTNVLDQIVNIKVVDIQFKHNQTDAYIKYMDSVVMHYLSQMLPSNVIVNISYKTT